MTDPQPIDLHLALEQLMTKAGADPRLRPEIERARREFFGLETRSDLAQPARRQAAEERFAEWYLLERDSEVLGEVPARTLGARRDRELLDDSLVGVFLVEQSPADAVRLRDLQDETVIEMVPTEMLAVRSGDLLVGRLFPTGSGPYVPSAAVAVQRPGRQLATAFRGDVGSLELERRLTQVELEHLLFRRWAQLTGNGAGQPLERLEAELQTLLRAAGKDHLDAAEISAALARTAAPGAVMGPLLDELAFDTAADLDVARRLLLEIWNVRGPRPGAAAPAPPSAAEPLAPTAPAGGDDEGGLGARIARRIEEGIEQHEDLESLFEEVQAMVGDAAADDDEESASGLDDGDLEPLALEFLWEEGCGEGPEQLVLTALVAQQREAPVPRLDLEYVQTEDLLRLLLRVYLESPPAVRAVRVRHTYEVLQRFYAWAERTQEYALEPVVGGCREPLIDQVERVHRASLALSATDDPAATRGQPTLARVVELGRGGFELVPCAETEPVWIERGDRHELEEGDLVLGVLQRTAEGTAVLEGMVVVMPPCAESFLG